jgi:hypothetical protein
MLATARKCAAYARRELLSTMRERRKMVVSPVSTSEESRTYVHHTALKAIRAGISVVPVRSDGSKRPALDRWQTYQHYVPTSRQLNRWFRDTCLGLALITGAISGGLEALDFDDQATFQAWLGRIQRYPEAVALYERIAWGYEEATPAGGRHLLYRCEDIAGNQKLAMRPVPGPQKYKSLIETRGEGGLIIVAPSRGTVHPSGRPYMLLRGDVAKIITISSDERVLLFAMARSFDEMPPPEPRALPVPGWYGKARGKRPGDIFNQRASWQEVLAPHGWELVRVVGEEGQWRKPGKEGPGISATTNFAGTDLLYVFSTSTCFEPQRGYSKFTAYAILNHGGDYSAAAHELAERGYVE